MLLLPTLKYDQAIAKQSVHPPSFLPGGLNLLRNFQEKAGDDLLQGWLRFLHEK